MVRARHRRPPPPPPPPPPLRPPRPSKFRVPIRRCQPDPRKYPRCIMSSFKPKPPKPKKRPPPWRKPENVELSEEIRDLERDIAIHSESPSGANDGQTQAHNAQPGTQECDKAGLEKPTMSWARKRRSAASKKNPVPWRKKHTVVDLSHEICDLERDIALHPDSHANTSTRDARALNRAAGRIARVEASRSREACKPKKAARKQGS
jgi:hypothetical protein